MKKIRTLVAGSLLCCAMITCLSPAVFAEEAERADSETIRELRVRPGLRIAVVSKGIRGEFWSAIRSGMEETVDEVNEAKGFEKKDRLTMTFEGAYDESDIDTLINTLDAVIAENPDVICLSAGDRDSCYAQLEAARENGIPVITFDSGISDVSLTSGYCATDNTAVGRLAGEQMAKALRGTGQIAVFSAQGKSQSIQDRITGFSEVISTFSDMGIVNIIYQNEVEDMPEAIREVLEQYPDLGGVFCTNADAAEFYLDVKQDGDEPPVMIGVDATSAQQKAVRSGEEYGIVSQNPRRLGRETILTALRHAEDGMRTSDEDYTEISLEPLWIDARVLDAETAEAYLY